MKRLAKTSGSRQKYVGVVGRGRYRLATPAFLSQVI